MQNKIYKMLIVGLVLLFSVTGCSFSEDDNKQPELVYDEPALKLSYDYAVGQYVYKDGKEYYIHENELVENKPEWNLFSAKLEENEFSFQWYEQGEKLTISSDQEVDTYYFEYIEGCTSHALLVLKDMQSENRTYKLCDIKNNSIESLFGDKLETYAVDHIQVSSDLTHAIVSADRGEDIFVFDGENAYPLYELVKGNKENLWGARFVDNQILILETKKNGTSKVESAYLYDCQEKTIKQTADRIVIGEPGEERHSNKYIYYAQDGIFKITNLVTGVTVETNLSYDDLYYIYIVLEEQVVVATNEGNIMLLDSESAEVVAEVETGAELTYSESEENYSLEYVKSDEGIYIALYKQGDEILIYKLEK